MGEYIGYSFFWGFSEDDIEGGIKSLRNCISENYILEKLNQGKNPSPCKKRPCVCDYSEYNPLQPLESDELHGFILGDYGFSEEGRKYAFMIKKSIVAGDPMHMSQVNIKNGFEYNYISPFFALRDGLRFKLKTGIKPGWRVGAVVYP